MNILVVVDVQEDFVNGVLGSEYARKVVVPNIVKKMRANHYDAIFYTRDIHDLNYPPTAELLALPPHCLYNSGNELIIKDVLEAANAREVDFFDKNVYGSYDMMEYCDQYIDDCKETTFEIVGLVSDICVLTTSLMLRSAMPYSHIIVDSNCCGGTTKEAHDAAMMCMRSCNIEVK